MRKTLKKTITLPPPVTRGRMSLEKALLVRRSVREFAATPLTGRQISQLLWAAQGVVTREGFRTAPSAGALYPLELYAVKADGMFHYQPRRHRLSRLSDLDLRPPLFRATFDQKMVLEAPCTFVIAAVDERIARKYGRARCVRYVDLEVGHAAQNLLLEVVALGLGSVAVAAFKDAGVKKALGLPADQRPVYLLPVGRPR